MEATWTEKLTPEEEEYLIAQLAYEVKRRKMETPAVFFIEAHKPLAGLSESLSVVLTPFLAPFIGLGNVQGYGRLLNNRDAVDRLLLALEDPGDPVKPVKPLSMMEEGTEGTAMTSKNAEVNSDV
jgi:hypothetical protein